MVTTASVCLPWDGNGTTSRWIAGNFIAWRRLWVQRLLVKIRLLVGGVVAGVRWGGGKISCVERIYGAKEHVELSTKVRLARRSPPHSLLSYCIVSMPRCAVLEQVFFPLIRPSPFYTGSLLALSSLFLSLCSSLSSRATRSFTLARSLPTLIALPNYRSSS